MYHWMVLVSFRPFVDSRPNQIWFKRLDHQESRHGPTCSSIVLPNVAPTGHIEEVSVTFGDGRTLVGMWTLQGPSENRHNIEVI